MSDGNENNSTPILIDFDQIEQVARVFFIESKEILDELDDLILHLENNPDDSAAVNNLFRRVHTLKGSVGAVPGGQLLGSLAHEFEALLSKLKKEKKSVTKECADLFLHSSKLLKLLAEGLREQTEILPEVLSEVIELINRYGHFEWPAESEGNSKRNCDINTVESAAAKSGLRKAPVKKSTPPPPEEEGVWLTQSQLNEIMRIQGEILILKNHFQMMVQTGDFQTRQTEFSQGLGKISDLFQSQLGKVLKVRAEECFKGLGPLVRQASTELNKEVLFTSGGMDLWIDKSLGRDINEAVMHLIRNSIDHGVEDPFDRATQGKPSLGQLQFSVSEKNGFVVAEFHDDGRGLDRERILRKALEQNLVSEAEAPYLSEQQIFAFIFHPGFSTKEKITTISGRGVGMDVVHATVEKYHGKIAVESSPGQGARFTMHFALPQHLVMESVILCQWRQLQMALPLGSVMQIQSLSELQQTQAGDLRYAQWSGMTVPLVDYEEILRSRALGAPEKEMSVLFLRHQEYVVGLLVDKVLGQSDLMVKGFTALIKTMPGFKGTSVLADDRVTYVVDPDKLIQLLKIPSPSEQEAA